MTGLIEQEPYLRIKKMFDEKKFDEIIVYCQKLLVKDPKNKIALQNISTAYNIVGGYHDAIQSSNKIFAITQGDKGASILSDKKLIKIDPEEILKLVDTTGAGDLFAAGFLEYLILNKNISDCGQRGVQMASKVIQQYGARL